MTYEDCEDCGSCNPSEMTCYSELEGKSNEKQKTIDEMTEELEELKGIVSDKVYDLRKHIEDMNDAYEPAITLLDELEKHFE